MIKIRAVEEKERIKQGLAPENPFIEPSSAVSMERPRSLACDAQRSGRACVHMRRWALTIALDPSRELPMFLRLAGALAGDIRMGRLKSGEPLPGTRDLAIRLRVNRNTVVAGYAELAAERLVETRSGGGTFVVDPAPTPPERVPRRGAEPTYVLSPALPTSFTADAPAPGTLILSSAMPDVRLFAARVCARC